MIPPGAPREPALPIPREADPGGNLGGWHPHPTAILTRRRQRVAQQCLLIPPAGFAGRARLAVIGEGRREEFSGVWEPGDRSPLAFGVPLDPESPETVRADLLLETEATSPPAAGRTKSTGRVMLRRPPLDIQIYIAPLLARSEAPPGPLAVSPTRQTESDLSLLKAARRALQRDRTLRAAWHESWSARIVALHWEAEIRTWCGEGRLELLSGGACEPPTRAALALPAASQTYLLGPGRGSWPAEDLLPATRQVLIPEAALPAVPDEGSPTTTPPPAGRPLRLSLAGRWFLAHGYAPDAGFDPMADTGHPATLAWFDRVIRHAVRWRSRSAAMERGARRDRRAGARARRGPQTQVLGFAPLTLSTVKHWKALPKYTQHWNKGHLSPRLIAATPADYFAMVTALEEQGAVRLRQAYG